MSPAAAVAAVGIGVCAVVGIVLAITDLRSHRLPNALVLPLYPAAAVVCVARAVDLGAVWPVVSGAVGGLVLFAAYLLLRRFGGGVGGGDVKLAGAVGMLAGSVDPVAPVVATALAFVGAGVVAAVLIASHRATRSTRIPFGPFMIAGAAVAIVPALSPAAETVKGALASAASALG